MFVEHSKKKEERVHDIEHRRTQIDLLTMNIMSKYEKVNAMGQQSSYEDQDIDIY